MAINEQISDLASGTFTGTEVLPFDTAGRLTRKATIADVAAYTIANIPVPSSPANTIYVATNGSDIAAAGRGTINKPFLTEAGALTAVISPSSTNTYTLQFSDGTFTLDTALPQFVKIRGNGNNNTRFNVTIANLLSANYLATTNAIIDVQDATITGNFSLDFTGNNGALCYFNGVRISGNFNIANTSGSGPLFLFNDSNVLGNTTIPGNIGFMANSSLFALVSVSSPASSAAMVFFDSKVTQFSLSNFATVNSYGNPQDSSIGGELLINGTNSNFYCDAVSYPSISLSGGATLSQVHPISVANGILANVSPSHYTPADTSVAGHLKGIDNALGSSGSLPIVTTSSSIAFPANTIVNVTGSTLVNLTIPATLTVGQVFPVVCISATATFKIIANTGQVITIGNKQTTSGGSATSSALGDSLYLVAVTTTSLIQVGGAQGSFNTD